jgi:hypothetical protein
VLWKSPVKFVSHVQLPPLQTTIFEAPMNRRERRANQKLKRKQKTMSNTPAGNPQDAEMLLQQAPPMCHVVAVAPLAKRLAQVDDEFEKIINETTPEPAESCGANYPMIPKKPKPTLKALLEAHQPSLKFTTAQFPELARHAQSVGPEPVPDPEPEPEPLLERTLDCLRVRCQHDTGTDDFYLWGGRAYKWSRLHPDHPRFKAGARFWVCRVDQMPGQGDVYAEPRYVYPDNDGTLRTNSPSVFLVAQRQAILAEHRIDEPPPPAPEPPPPVVPEEWHGIKAVDLPKLYIIARTYYRVVGAMQADTDGKFSAEAEVHLIEVKRICQGIRDQLSEIPKTG